MAMSPRNISVKGPTYERNACKKHPVKFNDTELRDLPGGSVHLTLATDAKSVINSL